MWPNIFSLHSHTLVILILQVGSLFPNESINDLLSLWFSTNSGSANVGRRTWVGRTDWISLCYHALLRGNVALHNNIWFYCNHNAAKRWDLEFGFQTPRKNSESHLSAVWCLLITPRQKKFELSFPNFEWVIFSNTTDFQWIWLKLRNSEALVWADSGV